MDEAIRMLQISTYLFVLTALGGVAMGWVRFSANRNPASWLAMTHGFLAAAGVTLLAYAVFVLHGPGLALVSLLLFLGASVGGVVLNLVYHLKDKPLPKSIVAIHGAVAVLGFVLLYMAAFTGS